MISELQLVLVVVLVGWVGIFLYLRKIDQRLSRLESNQEKKEWNETLH